MPMPLCNIETRTCVQPVLFSLSLSLSLTHTHTVSLWVLFTFRWVRLVSIYADVFGKCHLPRKPQSNVIVLTLFKKNQNTDHFVTQVSCPAQAATDQDAQGRCDPKIHRARAIEP